MAPLSLMLHTTWPARPSLTSLRRLFPAPSPLSPLAPLMVRLLLLSVVYDYQWWCLLTLQTSLRLSSTLPTLIPRRARTISLPPPSSSIWFSTSTSPPTKGMKAPLCFLCVVVSLHAAIGIAYHSELPCCARWILTLRLKTRLLRRLRPARRFSPRARYEPEWCVNEWISWWYLLLKW